MANVTFITFYNDFSVGVNILSNILFDAGHDVSVIFFKLPSKTNQKWFKDSTIYLEAIDTYGDIIGGNIAANKWNDNETDLLIQKVGDLKSEIICISCRSTDRELAEDVLPKIRQTTNAVFLAGGFGPTLEPEIFVDLVDYVFIGEAENKIAEIISAIEKDMPLESMDNICFRDKDNGKITKNKLSVPDVKKYQFSDIITNTYFIENSKIYDYDERASVIGSHKYSIFAGRGCIGTCTYCSAGRWFETYHNEGIQLRKRRNRVLDDIIEELLKIKDKEFTFIFFRDSFLSGSTKFLEELFYLYERHINLPFWAQFFPKQMVSNPNLLKMAVDAGFVDTEIGFQSGSDRINKTIFDRHISNNDTIKYTQMLAEHDINMKYDFIVFNPAETKDDINKSYNVIQALPKKRSYLYLPRLLNFPGTPINERLKGYSIKPSEFGNYYAQALLLLLCFVMNESEFDKILKDQKLTSSWQSLLQFYKLYIKKHNIDFQIGTHDVPNSITTHRYHRILKRKQYTDVIVWGFGDYFYEMAHIFNNVNIRFHISDNADSPSAGLSSPEVLRDIKEALPIFICSPRKQEIKIKILKEFSSYPGENYV
ncbi:MAG: radical SAM protein [Pseudomonadota bacterium]